MSQDTDMMLVCDNLITALTWQELTWSKYLFILKFLKMQKLKNVVRVSHTVKSLITKTEDSWEQQKLFLCLWLFVWSKSVHNSKNGAVFQVTDREMQDFSQTQLMDQGPMHNSGIDIPKRKDKEDLTESSEVCLSLSHRNTHNPKKLIRHFYLVCGLFIP